MILKPGGKEAGRSGPSRRDYPLILQMRACLKNPLRVMNGEGFLSERTPNRFRRGFHGSGVSRSQYPVPSRSRKNRVKPRSARGGRGAARPRTARMCSVGPFGCFHVPS